MKEYHYPSRLFRKEWHWFEKPHDIPGADLLNFFSYDNINAPGFKKKSGMTTIIDLVQTEDVLWSKLRKRYAREQIEKAKRNGIDVHTDISWEHLVGVYEKFRKGKKISSDDPRVFQHCRVYAALVNNEILAMGAFVEDEKYSRALVLASDRFSNEGKRRELVGQANRMLIWEAMRDARSRGILQFDLGGIALESDKREDKSLLEFKEAFGGERKVGYYYTKVNSRLLKLFIKTRRFLHI
ncbi:MAG: hypothetical protein A2845_03420 [Candidatus Lloydbacteria bacterium RIFCSPHIGHO2_01_FULL_49_22]|uniref:BioF2-like acetyltransferase domain-containing protein n=1 Tax=Candidatus Lloydbacteria bacterium RIFCSPHIGHO2_01_FULL_49_22 TaxID=1798658 RepID=A0A1G2CZ90_9BACT|nr:MAG: hypothetical protein A2845_03420 [Candidatus Lloydbacteria bacterium RIFCSPHIGHO2_01_FULL_49_22]OGZ08981.1 MAG: hypothetical protein A3C14_03255 [Candidatus Lloydbacteria bacterium RIFCSPHIGHO2_02_FULL_50_18]